MRKSMKIKANTLWRNSKNAFNYFRSRFSKTSNWAFCSTKGALGWRPRTANSLSRRHWTRWCRRARTWSAPSRWRGCSRVSRRSLTNCRSIWWSYCWTRTRSSCSCSSRTRWSMWPMRCKSISICLPNRSIGMCRNHFSIMMIQWAGQWWRLRVTWLVSWANRRSAHWPCQTIANKILQIITNEPVWLNGHSWIQW